MFSVDEIAAVAYHAHRGYNHVIGDPWIDPQWAALPEWHKEAVRDGVRAALAGLDPRQMHENWCAYYRERGWVYGPDKDPAADPPTHPCLVDYDDLPPEHQLKDTLFREFVLMLARTGTPGSGD